MKMQALVSLTNSLYVTGNSILNQLAISGKRACNEVIVTSGGVYIKTKTLFSYKDTHFMTGTWCLLSGYII